MLHFFNVVALNRWSKVPFVTTFETTLPRYQTKGWLYQRAIEAMRCPRCKRLLALSECSKRRQAKELLSAGALDVMDKV